MYLGKLGFSTHPLSSLDPDRKYFLSPSTSKGTARSCSLCLADWRARQARVFKVLPKVPPQELDSTHGEVLEDVIHVKHNEHGDTKYPNLAILKYLDFKVKSLMLAGEKATDNDVRWLKVCEYSGGLTNNHFVHDRSVFYHQVENILICKLTKLCYEHGSLSFGHHTSFILDVIIILLKYFLISIKYD